MSKPKFKFNVVDLIGALPIVIAAIEGIVDEVEGSKAKASPGDAKITPEEGVALAKEVHERLFPLAEYIVSKLT